MIGVREATPFAITAEPVQLSGFDLPTKATVALASVANNATEGKVELVLPARLLPGTYTFVINGAGQAPRNYALATSMKKGAPKSKAGNVRVVHPSNAITITVLQRK